MFKAAFGRLCFFVWTQVPEPAFATNRTKSRLSEKENPAEAGFPYAISPKGPDPGSDPRFDHAIHPRSIPMITAMAVAPCGAWLKQRSDS